MLKNNKSRFMLAFSDNHGSTGPVVLGKRPFRHVNNNGLFCWRGGSPASRIGCDALRPAGFTLIELLVVIAIIVLLVSILVPSLQKAKQITQSAVCAAGMREIGITTSMFSQERDTRGPGRASMIRYGQEQWQTWAGILNHDFYDRDVLQSMGYEPQEGKIYCPSIAYLGTDYPAGSYPRAYGWTTDALGGYNWGVYPKEGEYGLKITSPDSDYKFYSLGARLTDFKRPGYQILLREWYMNKADGWNMGTSGTIELDANNVALNLGFAFRHPGVRANFLFADMHVESLPADGSLNEPERFKINP